MDTTDGQTPNPQPSDVATQHLAGNKSARLGTVKSIAPSSNNTLVVQNEDISTGDGDGRQGLKAKLEQLLKVAFFILHTPSLAKFTSRLYLTMDSHQNELNHASSTHQTVHKTR